MEGFLISLDSVTEVPIYNEMTSGITKDSFYTGLFRAKYQIDTNQIELLRYSKLSKKDFLKTESKMKFLVGASPDFIFYIFEHVYVISAKGIFRELTIVESNYTFTEIN